MTRNALIEVIVCIILTALAFWLLGYLGLPALLEKIFTVAIIVMVVLFLVGVVSGWTPPWRKS